MLKALTYGLLGTNPGLLAEAGAVKPVAIVNRDTAHHSLGHDGVYVSQGSLSTSINQPGSSSRRLNRHLAQLINTQNPDVAAVGTGASGAIANPSTTISAPIVNNPLPQATGATINNPAIKTGGPLVNNPAPETTGVSVTNPAIQTTGTIVDNPAIKTGGPVVKNPVPDTTGVIVTNPAPQTTGTLVNNPPPVPEATVDMSPSGSKSQADSAAGPAAGPASGAASHAQSVSISTAAFVAIAHILLRAV